MLSHVKKTIMGWGILSLVFGQGMGGNHHNGRPHDMDWPMDLQTVTETERL